MESPKSLRLPSASQSVRCGFSNRSRPGSVAAMRRHTPTGPIYGADSDDEDERYPLVPGGDLDASSELEVARRRWYPNGQPMEDLALRQRIERAPAPALAPIAYPELPAAQTTDRLTPGEQVAVSVMIAGAVVGGWLGYQVGDWGGAAIGAGAGLLTLSTLLSGAGGLRERVRSLWMLATLVGAIALGAALGQTVSGYTGGVVGALIAGLVVAARLPL